MKAIVYDVYGLPDVLRLEEVPTPVPKDNEVLVHMQAASVNAADWEILTGKPSYTRPLFGWFRPRNRILGSDIAGRVEAVGRNVTTVRPGDDVFGDIFDHRGAFAEYVCAREDQLIAKPAGLSFEDAATLPQAGILALQGIHLKGKVHAGQKILIIGAGGGVGSFAIQLAKRQGAHVTAVDNGEKVDLMRALGADQTIDYRQADIAQNGQRYDLILDMVGAQSVLKFKQMLADNGTYLVVGGTTMRILHTLIVGGVLSLLGNKSFGILGWDQSRRNMTAIMALVETDAIKPAIDKHYTLDKVPDALRYLGAGHAKGKLIITMGA